MQRLLPDKVFLEKDTHRYYDNDSAFYISVSHLFDHVKEKFDSDRISYFSARKQLREEGTLDPTESQIELRAKALRGIWKTKNLESTTIGTFIHDLLESYLLNKIPPAESPWREAVPDIAHKYILSKYKNYFPEQILYSKRYYVAGMSDIPCMRISGKNPVIDIGDYKTNMSKGITYDNQYGKFFLDPVSHLEDCSYTEYALKLSMYGVMLEEHGYRIGRLFLIYIPPKDPMKHFEIPLPYMKAEAENILSYLSHNKHILKQEPVIISDVVSDEKKEWEW